MYPKIVDGYSLSVCHYYSTPLISSDVSSDSDALMIDESPVVSEYCDELVIDESPIINIDCGTQTETSYLQNIERENSRLKRNNKRLLQQIQVIEEAKLNLEYSISLIFTPGQIKKLKNPNKRIHFSLDDISTSISLHCAGPRLYRLLRKRGFPFPSVSTLRRWGTNLDVRPGLCQSVLSLLEQADLNDRDKTCVLSFDEMKVSEAYEYDKKLDTTLEPANFVQVAMIRGLFKDWKQPVFYQFDCPMTKNILFSIISSLEAIKFHVAAIVSDLGPTNQKLWKELGISDTMNFFSNPVDSDKQIFVFADVPHLLKLIRNHFIDEGFVLEDEILNQNPIRQLIQLTGSLELKAIHKISATHLDVRGPQRMKVKLAAQLFSNTVAKSLERCASLGYLGECSNWTSVSEFIKAVNDWFDCFNVRVPFADHRAYKKGFGLALQEQTAIIDSFSEIIRKMRIRGKNNMLPFQKGILISNSSLKGLYEHLKANWNNVDFLLTYRLNQDVLENFFAHIRAAGGLRDHPKQIEFKYRFRSYLLGRNQDILSSAQNCTEDGTVNLSSVLRCNSSQAQSTTAINSTFNSGTPIQNELDAEIGELDSPTISYVVLHTLGISDLGDTEMLNHEFTELEADGIEHMAGAMIKKLSLKHDISNMGVLASSNKDKTYSWINHLSEGGLYKPTDSFLAGIEGLEKIFKFLNDDQDGEERLLITENYIQKHLDLCETINLPSYVKSLFFRSRLYFRMRTLNR